MERKTKVHAEEGKQELTVTREFDLPLELLFRAYTEPEFLEQWMGTKVIKLENKKHGSWQFRTSDPSGKVLFSAGGCIHEFLPERQIVRTFEMENVGFAPQIEFLDFESLGGNKSRLTMQIIYRSVALRDQQLQLPFAQGVNMAHNKLEEVFNQSK